MALSLKGSAPTFTKLKSSAGGINNKAHTKWNHITRWKRHAKYVRSHFYYKTYCLFILPSWQLSRTWLHIKQRLDVHKCILSDYNLTFILYDACTSFPPTGSFCLFMDFETTWRRRPFHPFLFSYYMLICPPQGQWSSHMWKETRIWILLFTKSSICNRIQEIRSKKTKTLRRLNRTPNLLYYTNPTTPKPFLERWSWGENLTSHPVWVYH